MVMGSGLPIKTTSPHPCLRSPSSGGGVVQRTAPEKTEDNRRYLWKMEIYMAICACSYSWGVFFWFCFTKWSRAWKKNTPCSDIYCRPCIYWATIYVRTLGTHCCPAASIVTGGKFFCEKCSRKVNFLWSIDTFIHVCIDDLAFFA